MRKGSVVLVVLALVLCLAGAASAQGLVGAGGVGLLGMGPGWYVGAQRVTSFLVTREGITEVANVALSTTIRGGLAGAVIMAMVIAEPAFNSGVDSIRTYMQNLGAAGWSVSGGQLYKPGVATGGPKTFIPGSADYTSWSNVMSHYNSIYSSIGVSFNVYNSYSDAQTALGVAYAAGGGYTYMSEAGSYGSGNVTGAALVTLNHSTGAAVSACIYGGPNTVGEQVQNNTPPPPVVATTTDLTGKIQTDLASSTPAALAAADEAEDILHKGVPFAGNAAAAPPVADGTSSPPPAGVVVDTTIPATPTTGATTPGAEAVNVATAGLPSSGAITSTPPAAGTSQATTQDQPYTDPSYSGSFTSVPWATPSDFAARWSTFASGVQSTGLFGLWGSAFGSPGSGGGSSYTFNAGSLGTHTYDFSSWGSTVFGLLSGLIQITCGFVAVKIATVKGG
jgi:hypothetical protein